MPRFWEVVVASSHVENRQNVAGMLFRLGLDPICVSSVDQCRTLPKRGNIGLVFCDRDLKGGDYRDVVAAVSGGSPEEKPKVVMMADLAQPDEYQQAKKSGVFDVISSPCRPTDVEWMVISAKRDRKGESQNLIRASGELAAFRRSSG